MRQCVNDTSVRGRRALATEHRRVERTLTQRIVERSAGVGISAGRGIVGKTHARRDAEKGSGEGKEEGNNAKM